MKIGVLGGTFNPPHIGHTHAAVAARDALGLEKILFVPTNQPPHKEVPEGSADTRQRVEMACLAAESIGAEVSDAETSRGGKSYTADTLDILKAQYSGAEIWLIMGTDMFLSLHKWYAPERIFKNACIAVVARDASGIETLSAQKEYLEREFGARAEIIDADVIEISSTELRRGENESCLCPQVRDYIRRNKLYRKAGDTGEA